MRRSSRPRVTLQRQSPLATIIVRPAIALTSSPVIAVNSPKTLYQQWCRMSWKYKAAAATAITIGLVAVIFGIIFPPILLVTIPLIKISCSSLLIISGSLLTVLTAVGHVCHLYYRTQVPDEQVFRPASPVQETLTHTPTHENSDEFATESPLFFYDESIVSHSDEQRDLQLHYSSGTILEMLQLKNQPTLSTNYNTVEESMIVDHPLTSIGHSDSTSQDCTASPISIQNLSSR